MQSAFGIEHGDEINKAFGMGGLLKPLTGMARGLGSKMGAGATSMGTKGFGGAGKRIAGGGAHRGAGALGGGLSGGLKRAGSVMSAHPGATGAAAIGGSTAAVGGTGFALGRRKQF